MRRTVFYFLLAAALPAFGSASTTVRAQDAPEVVTEPNAPGWITVGWKHNGEEGTRYIVERQEPPASWLFFVSTGIHTDKNLKPSTTYKYRVCAVDENDEKTCSEWTSQTTLEPASSGTYSVPVITEKDVAPDRIRISWTSTTHYGSFNVRWSEKGTPAGQHNVRGNGTSGSFEARGLVPGRTFAFLVQGCNWGPLGSGCSGWTGVELSTPLGPPPHPTAPAVTASASSPSQIVLSWPVNGSERIDQVVIERDGRKHVERSGALSRYDDSVRPNTEYVYRVCLTNQTGTACSSATTAMGRPTVPSALADVKFVRVRSSGAGGGILSGDAARIRTIVRSNWRNAGTPGQFITLERQDRGPVDPIRVGTFWTEVNRISAKTDPTDIAIEARPPGPQVGIREGNIYRVCAVVPALGRAGKVCSTPSALTAEQAAEQISQKINLNALAAKGELIAKQDPLAVELRNQQADGPTRRGFDIGMAAAEGHTADGPGKQRIQTMLSPVEQIGYRMAVSFSLERNRYAERAALGAAIAEADSAIGEVRNAKSDVFYKLGFDIATAIFGDPARGAQGNTTTGPGSLGIRNSLSPGAQSGFNDSLALNLSRREFPVPRDPSTPVIPSPPISANRSKRAPKIGETTPQPDYRELRCRGTYGMNIKSGTGIHHQRARS